MNTETAASEQNYENLPSSAAAIGTIADAALPGTAFHPEEFDVDVSQTSLAEADEVLKATLEEAMRAVGGTRAFLALVDTTSGQLALRFTAGEGWTEDVRRLRVNLHPDEPGSVGARSEDGRRGITRHVLLTNRRYWTGDVNNDPHYIRFFDDVQSEVAVPIITQGGGAVGVINIESDQPNAFTEEHANELSVLARRVALIIAMAEHQLREEALIAIGKEFNSLDDLEALMLEVVRQATKVLRADDCSLFLMDDDDDMLRLAASYGHLKKSAGVEAAPYGRGEGLTGWVAQHAQVIRTGDPRHDPRWKGLIMEAPAGEIAAVLAAPVLTQRSKTGVLRVVRLKKGLLTFLSQEFTQADEDIFVTLASQLAVAIDRTRLLNRILHAERMAAWGEMSARAAHMIGNTVFGVKGHLNELNHIMAQNTKAETQPHDWDEAKQLMEHVSRGIYRLEGILSEFRDFVLATQLHATENELNQLMRRVTAESFPKNSNIDLVLNLAPQLPPVAVDEVKLKRAFSELIENSVDFQPLGGQLTIRTSLAEPEVVSALTRRTFQGPVVQVEFIDHGPGLSEQDRERVFTPFYTRKAKGMGLGLSIVKGIIEAHGGVIREIGDLEAAKPLPDNRQGAHFVVLLPTIIPQEAPPEATRETMQDSNQEQQEQES
jgi:signal transduction histidine kinase